MYLHGGTSKGSDNIAQMKEPGIDSIANYLTSHNIKGILLVPQCPADKSWSGPTLPMLKALIAQYTDSGEADPDKVLPLRWVYGRNRNMDHALQLPQHICRRNASGGKPIKMQCREHCIYTRIHRNGDG